MPYLSTAQEWLTQSSLLLAARPTTTRITTKYTLSKKRKSKSKAAPTPDVSATIGGVAVPASTRATLTLKAYDPESGTTLKYVTDKAAEVGRLVAGLGRLGRGMAGLEEIKEDVAMGGAEQVEADGAGEGAVKLGGQAGGQGGAPAGKKGKKKGKK